MSSRILGDDRIDTHGANAGFYERATGVEICEYFRRVLDEHLIPSGRVRFLGMTEYVGVEDGLHRLVSVASGEETEVRVRRRLVDATYVESSIPSRHDPSFGVDEGAIVVPPNELVHLASAPSGFTVLGGGKTAMDTCGWLLDQGVDPERICWVRPSELWLFNRAKIQPLDLVGSYMQLQASWVAASAAATGSLRSIRDVRPARVRHVGTAAIRTDAGEIPNDPGRVVVDCTAAGLRPSPPRPAFEGDRITVQYLTLGYLCWSAALLALVEAAPLTDPERNALCPPVPFSGRIGDVLYQANAVLQGIAARGAVPEIAGWNDASRLNPAAGLGPRMQHHDVVDALGRIGGDVGGAFRNLARLAPLDRFPVA